MEPHHHGEDAESECTQPRQNRRMETDAPLLSRSRDLGFVECEVGGDRAVVWFRHVLAEAGRQREESGCGLLD